MLTVLVFRPQFPERWWRDDLRGKSRPELSPNDAEVLAFLDDKHERFGANSVVYIRSVRPL